MKGCIKVRNIFIDPKWTHLSKKWWHKLLFWKTFNYAEDAPQKRQFISLNELKGK